MTERLPEIENVQIPMRDGKMQSINGLRAAGVDWRTIVQIAYASALQTKTAYPEVGEIPDPEDILRDRREAGLDTNLQALCYYMVRLSEAPVQRRARRSAEIENDRREREESIWREAMNGDGAW